jgi:hypothetical protein
VTALGDLIREAWRADVELVVGADGGLVARFDGDPPGDLLARLSARKPELVALRCPDCAHVRGGDGVCRRKGCEFRGCARCGTATGSQFIRLCWVCQGEMDRAANEGGNRR